MVKRSHKISRKRSQKRSQKRLHKRSQKRLHKRSHKRLRGGFNPLNPLEKVKEYMAKVDSLEKTVQNHEMRINALASVIENTAKFNLQRLERS